MQHAAPRPTTDKRSRSRLSIPDRILLAVIVYFVFALTLRGALAQDMGMDLDQVTSGSLLLESQGQWIEAPRLGTEVNMRVSGIMAEVTVSQRFINSTGDWIEGTYAFPLPENAAVNRMVLQIDQRRIEGEIQEKQQAAETYRAARAAGQQASLVTQSRPNLFNTRVANVPPGEEVVVELSYLQQLDYRDGQFTLRFPMTITPRYRGGAEPIDGVPAAEPTTLHAPAPQWTSSATAEPSLSLQIYLDPGFELVHLESRHHDIDIADSNGLYLIHLADDRVVPDHDFELVWEPARKASPKAALFTETRSDGNYALLMVMPPADTHVVPQPRELILIVDTSGSMHGASLEQARLSLQMAIGSLRPDDRFNLIRFSNEAESLFDQAVAANDAALVEADDWISRLEAGGGTEMASALDLALAGQASSGYVRQIVFVTDGSVGNEVELFRLIEEKLGESRLFTVGIGSAPNGYFMRKAAQFGRGTYTFIGKVAEVAEKMHRLLDRLESPVLTDVCVDWLQAAELYPRELPDLYRNEPLVISARLDSLQGDIEVCGKTGLGSWNQWLSTSGDRPTVGVSTLWARRKIESLMDDLALGADAEATRNEVLETALGHQLMSRYTSFVAVDRTPARTREAALKRARIANIAPASELSSDPALALALPQTGTDAMQRLVFGLFLAMIGWIFILRLRDE